MVDHGGSISPAPLLLVCNIRRSLTFLTSSSNQVIININL